MIKDTYFLLDINAKSFLIFSPLSLSVLAIENTAFKKSSLRHSSKQRSRGHYHFKPRNTRYISTDGDNPDSSTPAEPTQAELRQAVATKYNNLEVIKEISKSRNRNFSDQCFNLSLAHLSGPALREFTALAVKVSTDQIKAGETAENIISSTNSVSTIGKAQTSAELTKYILHKAFLARADALLRGNGVARTREENEVRREYFNNRDPLHSAYSQASQEYMDSLNRLNNSDPRNSVAPSSAGPSEGPNAEPGVTLINPSVVPAAPVGTSTQVPAAPASSAGSSLIDDYADTNLDMQDPFDPD